MGKKKKDNQDSFKLELPSDDSATKKPLSDDHDPERDLGNFGDEPDVLFSTIKDMSKDLERAGADPEARQQIEWLQHQVKDISNLKDGDTLTSDQAEILRRYLSLKEAEVRDLRDQHEHYKAYVNKLSSEVEKANLRTRNLLTDMESLRGADEQARKEIKSLRNKQEEELLRLTNEYEERLQKSGNYESQVEDLIRKRDQWRERIKEELKRIKLKERELENRYELLKRDMQALLDSKDKHALELKNKNDALELEMESLEEKLVLSSRKLGSVEAKKRRLIETMKLALNLLETIDQDDASLSSSNNDNDLSSRKRKTG